MYVLNLMLAIVALLCPIIGLAALGWGLLWDPSRGRRRCPRCWYDCSGLSGLKCPECGHVARSERSLFRTRPSWLLTRAGLVLLAMGPYLGFVLPRDPAGEGWLRWLPSTVFVFVVPVDGVSKSTPGPNAMLDAWAYRHYRVWGWQRWIVSAREVWAMTDEDIAAIVLTHAKWPAGGPVVVTLDGGVSRPISGERMIQTKSIDGHNVFLMRHVFAPLPPNIHGFYSSNPDKGSREDEISGLPVGLHTLRFETTISGDGLPTRTVKHAITIDVVPAETQLLAPVETAALTKLVESAVSAGISDRPTDGPGIFFHLDSEVIWSAGPPPAIGVRFDVMDGNRLVLRSGCVLDLPRRGRSELVDEFCRLAQDEYGEVRKDVLDRLTVRIRSDQALAMSHFHATTYWKGEFVLPLRTLLDRWPKVP